MYGWIWHRLPGRWPARAGISLLLVALTVVLLFRFVFPYIEPRLPWNRSNVESSTPADNPVPAPPSARASPSGSSTP